MSYSSLDGPDTALAGVAHLGAIAGPLVPWLVWLSRRNEDPFVARESGKAINAGLAFLLAFAGATLIANFVPLIGFVGRLAQLAILVAAVFLCVHAFRRVRRGAPTSYPFQIKVVNKDD